MNDAWNSFWENQSLNVCPFCDYKIDVLKNLQMSFKCPKCKFYMDVSELGGLSLFISPTYMGINYSIGFRENETRTAYTIDYFILRKSGDSQQKRDIRSWVVGEHFYRGQTNYKAPTWSEIKSLIKSEKFNKWLMLVNN